MLKYSQLALAFQGSAFDPVGNIYAAYKFAIGANDTGVIISYNTEAPQVAGKNPVVLPSGMAINPVTWTRGEKTATAAESWGSVDMDEKGKLITLKNYADARVDKARGVVICSTVDVDKLSPGNQVFPKGIYHRHDYPFITTISEKTPL